MQPYGPPAAMATLPRKHYPCRACCERPPTHPGPPQCGASAPAPARCPAPPSGCWGAAEIPGTIAKSPEAGYRCRYLPPPAGTWSSSGSTRTIHAAVLGREFHRVRQIVVEHLLEARRIDHGLDSARHMSEQFRCFFSASGRTTSRTSSTSVSIRQARDGTPSCRLRLWKDRECR